MVPALRFSKSSLGKLLASTSPSNETVRDTESSGLLAIRYAKRGMVSFVYSGRIKGGPKRDITIGRYPDWSVEEARDRAAELRKLYRSGIDPRELESEEKKQKERKASFDKALEVTLREVMDRYLLARNLKQRTSKDYVSTMNSCFPGWLDKPIRDIDRRDVEDRFIELVQKGIKAQAVKAFRYLSAMMNYAKAEEISVDRNSNTESVRLITDNPCDVLKEKRYDRSLPSRKGNLSMEHTAKLLEILSHHNHPNYTGPYISSTMAHYVGLLLFTGIRRGEASSLKWSDVDFDQKTFMLHDTKNGEDFVIPMSVPVHGLLKAQQQTANGSEWVFPARDGTGHMAEPRKALERLSKEIGYRFTSHTLRHTFGSVAFEFGLEWGNIKKMLNHKSGDVTSLYVHANANRLRPMFDEIAQGLMSNYDGTWLGDVTEKQQQQDSIDMDFN